jgi:hypothetical protein
MSVYLSLNSRQIYTLPLLPAMFITQLRIIHRKALGITSITVPVPDTVSWAQRPIPSVNQETTRSVLFPVNSVPTPDII